MVVDCVVAPFEITKAQVSDSRTRIRWLGDVRASDIILDACIWYHLQ